MSYSQYLKGNSNVTMIEDLPDLENMQMGGQPDPSQESQFTQLPPEIRQKYQKFVRNVHHAPPESGMASYGNGPGVYTPQQPPTEHFQHMDGAVKHGEPVTNQQHHINSCMDIARHVEECPICTKYYGVGSDKTIYIIVIVFLAIICILLLKKVLNL